jgi:hypothetical protein
MIIENFDGSPDEYCKLVEAEAKWFYAHCSDSGFSFSVIGSRLSVTPAHAIDDEMASLIFTHKRALIEIISTNDKNALVISNPLHERQ